MNKPSDIKKAARRNRIENIVASQAEEKLPQASKEALSKVRALSKSGAFTLKAE